jgi:hypothetical protein
VSFYDVLGVAPDAPPAAIRRAYVSLARRYHPDFHTTDDPGVHAANQRAMQAVNEAWTVLSDPQARRRYDERIHTEAPGPRRTHEAREAAWAAAEEAQRAWQPFDDSDDEPDPRLVADEPGRTARSRGRQWLAVAPTLCFGAGVVLVIFGLIVKLFPLAALGGLSIVVSALLFIAVPLVELSASARNDRR